jgi:hypothetical protein
MIIYFGYVGNLDLVTLPNTENAELTFHIRDSNGRVDQWTRFEPKPDKLIAIFVVNGSAQNYFFTFPDGQEIELAPFLP